MAKDETTRSASATDPQSGAYESPQVNEVNEVNEFLRDLLGGERVIAFRRSLVNVAGGVSEALMLAQALYWSKGKEARSRGGWFWSTHHDWEEQLGVNRSQQRTARNNLLESNCGWTEKIVGMPQRVWYRIDLDQLRKRVLACRHSNEQIQPKGEQIQPGGEQIQPRGEQIQPTSGENQPPYEQVQPISSLKSPLKSSLKSPSSETAPHELTLHLHSLLGTVDDDAVSELWRECRSNAPDCTPEEVLDFANHKLIGSNGRIQNPMGFLLTAVPKCFKGKAFAAFREQQRKSSAMKSNGGEATNQFSRDNLRNYFTATAAQIRKSAANHPTGKRRLLQVARAVEEIELPASPDVEFVERQLSSIDDKLHGVLVDLAGPKLLEHLDREIEKETARSYKKMSIAQRTEAQERCARPRIFKEFGMPRLTLLDVKPAVKGKPISGKHPERRYADAAESSFDFGEQQ